MPEISRASVKDTPANEPLFKQLSGLAARSLSTVRDLGLLNRDFLTVLPNRQDGISARYTPIRDAIVDAMKEKSLTPKHAGGHAAARQLLQAEAGLKDLLDREDIRFLIGGDGGPRDWAIAATQRNNSVDRFLRDLDIEQWGIEQFVEKLNNCCSKRGFFRDSSSTWRQGPDPQFLDWMCGKPAEWHRALYALFYREFEDKLHRLFDEICIVRRSDGEYGTGKECYFPTTDIREDPIHPRVEENTYTGGGTKKERADARKFLEGIGVREVGEREQVEAILKQRYSKEAKIPDKETHKSDLIRFIDLVEDDPKAAKLFGKYRIFERADGLWGQPDQVYLDAPYCDTGLHAFFRFFEDDEDGTHPVALSNSYSTGQMALKKFVAFARTCGVADRLKIATVPCKDNPENEYLHEAPGSYPTETGIDRDFVIPGLETLFESPDLALSHLVWNTLCERSNDKSILKATFRYNRSNAHHEADSQLVHQLRNAVWIPQQAGKFVRPAEALRDLLPDGFPFDPGWAWIKAIRFGEETAKKVEENLKKAEIAAELGFRDEDALASGKWFAGLPLVIQQRIFAEHENLTDLPTRELGDPGQRAEKVREEARRAPKRTSEKRERSVSVNRDPIKREKAVPYLREQYTNDDDVTICQVCQDSLPFKLDGNYYFEAVEFLLELEKHHHQNYLALCPNHAAMFMHANDSKEEVKNRFLALDGRELELTLAEQSVTVYFTDTHIVDLRAVIEVEDAE